MSLFRSLFQRTASDVPEFQSQIAPEQTFFAIGDVHGEIKALQRTFASFEQDAAIDKTNPMIVCLGDYIDRGENSAEVLTTLRALNKDFPDNFVCLMGNHEYMCLRFLEDPERRGERWLRFGGLQTLASFGVGLSANQSMTETRDALALAMGDGLITWLYNLPLMWRSGNVVALHAAADPTASMDEQTSETLLWGHPDFSSHPREDGLWVVHGHTIVESPQVSQGRVAIDTGAYATGRLTTAKISADGITFRTT